MRLAVAILPLTLSMCALAGCAKKSDYEKTHDFLIGEIKEQGIYNANLKTYQYNLGSFVNDNSTTYVYMLARDNSGSIVITCESQITENRNVFMSAITFGDAKPIDFINGITSFTQLPSTYTGVYTLPLDFKNSDTVSVKPDDNYTAEVKKLLNGWAKWQSTICLAYLGDHLTTKGYSITSLGLKFNWHM